MGKDMEHVYHVPLPDFRLDYQRAKPSDLEGDAWCPVHPPNHQAFFFKLQHQQVAYPLVMTNVAMENGH